MRYTAPAGQAGLLSFRRAWKQVPLHELHNTQTEYITMKKTLITLLALAGAAAGEEIILTLPGAQTVTNGEEWYLYTAAETLGKMLEWKKDYGVYAGNNGGKSSSMTGTSEGQEGYWSGSSITLAGRNGTQGESCLLVLGSELAPNSKVSSITLTAVIDADTNINGLDVEFGIGLIDGSNTSQYVSSVTKSYTASGSSDTAVEVTLTMNDSYTWKEGDKIVIATNGPKFTPAGDTYVVSDYTVAVTYTIPEPATATLSLLALCGLAARRRRH